MKDKVTARQKPTMREQIIKEHNRIQRTVKSAFKSAEKMIAKDVARQRKEHTTHYACKEIMDKYGGEAHCCRCTGHMCEEPMKTKRDELREKIEKVSDLFMNDIMMPGSKVIFFSSFVNDIMNKVDAYVREVIGEDESYDYHDEPVIEPYRNELRAEQRQRAGLREEGE